MKQGAEKKIFLTPDNIIGPCWSGNVMTPEEAKYMEEWVKERKAKQKQSIKNKISMKLFN